MTPRQVIRPDWPWADRLGISQAVRSGNTVYVSGQTALDRRGEIVGRGSMLEQARQAFRNIREVLEAAGGSMEDIVMLTAYLTDFNEFEGYAEARREVFPEIRCAVTGVEVSRLIDPDLMIEIEAIAQLET